MSESMKIKCILEICMSEWALPLEIWWTYDNLCFEILCFAVTFSKQPDEVRA